MTATILLKSSVWLRRYCGSSLRDRSSDIAAKASIAFDERTNRRTRPLSGSATLVINFAPRNSFSRARAVGGVPKFPAVIRLPTRIAWSRLDVRQSSRASRLPKGSTDRALGLLWRCEAHDAHGEKTRSAFSRPFGYVHLNPLKRCTPEFNSAKNWHKTAASVISENYRQTLA